MITSAPLPSWGDLFALLHSRTPDNQALALPWAGDDRQARFLYRSAWSLAALVELRKIEGEPRPRLWLPGFFCNASSAPARAAGADIVFYPITSALAPDWAACRKLASKWRPSLFVLVHYFGAAGDIEGARAFCDEVGAVLVEDAAHVLRPMARIGHAGDFALYSPHKLVGIPDGAVLVSHKGMGALDRVLAAMPAAHPLPWVWAMKRAVQMMIPETIWQVVRPVPDIPFEHDLSAESLPLCSAMSAAARKILARAIPRLNAESSSRRTAEKILRTTLGDVSGWSAWPTAWNADETPYRAVFICDTPEIAVERFSCLRRAGNLVESWPDLAPEVIADPVTHRLTIDLRHRLLAFPLPAKEKAGEFARACAVALR
jgi:dTDP-4-amino-4,6-dideoxygalactose transaminase